MNIRVHRGVIPISHGIKVEGPYSQFRSASLPSWRRCRRVSCGSHECYVEVQLYLGCYLDRQSRPLLSIAFSLQSGLACSPSSPVAEH